MDLLPHHLAQLTQGSGLDVEVIRERGYRSARSASELAPLLFSPAQRRVPGLLLPVCPPDGSNGLTVYRPDSPRTVGDRLLKYELPAGSHVRLDVPPRCRPRLGDPGVTLWFTEGQKKADALATHGLCAVGLLGVWSFKGQNRFGGHTLLADFDFIALKGRTVNVVFDSDVMVKPAVQDALERLTEHLQRRGARVNAVYLPPAGDQKVGVDDYLLTHGVADLEALVTAPRPAPQVAAAVELLDEAPATLTRPLALVGGRGYAAAWLWVKTPNQRTRRAGGTARTPNAPAAETERRMFIIRDDGVVFGDGGDRPLADLGVQLRIPLEPRDKQTWSARGVRSYRAGHRPAPRGVFHRLVSVIDRFMSFDRSLAGQEAMCGLVACYTLATWFTDAFDAMGFLWPNGSHGSGKTKLGVLICEVAYLGEVLLSGSTYACLRDLADLGATLLFDDCEGLADPRRSDPDKRALLLAGNRKGSAIAVKEPVGTTKAWRNRYVSTYCPRLFTAIRLPDPVLASRTIVIPLVRTGEPSKANADPLDHSLWPTDRRSLLDDLWAVGLANLSAMPGHYQQVAADAPLVGRNLEPWKGVLAVAHWLDACGEPGLYPQMCQLATAYQMERTELETPDLIRLVVRALLDVSSARFPVSPVSPVLREDTEIAVDVAALTRRVNELAIEDELAEGDGAEWANGRRVGWALSKLRLEKLPKREGQPRQRKVTLAQLHDLARAHALAATLPALPTGSPPVSPHMVIDMNMNNMNMTSLPRGATEKDRARGPAETCAVVTGEEGGATGREGVERRSDGAGDDRANPPNDKGAAGGDTLPQNGQNGRNGKTGGATGADPPNDKGAAGGDTLPQDGQNGRTAGATVANPPNDAGEAPDGPARLAGTPDPSAAPAARPDAPPHPALALGERLGWPCIRLAPHLTLRAGQDAWARFATRHPAELDAVYAAAQKLGGFA